MIIAADVNSLLNDFLVLVALVTLYEYPPIHEKAVKWMNEKVFTKENINPNYKEPLVKTVAQMQRAKLAEMNRL